MRDVLRLCLTILPKEHRKRWLLFPLLDTLHGALEAGTAAGVLVLARALQSPRSVLELPVVRNYAGEFAGLSDTALVMRLAIIFGAYFILKNLIILGTQWLRFRVQAEAQAAISKKLFRGYLLLPYPFHFQRHSAELLRNTTASVGTVVHTLQAFDQLLRRALTALGLLAMLVFANPLVTLVSAVLLVALVILMLRFTRALALRSGVEDQSVAQDMQQTAQNAFGGIKEIKAHGREEFFIGTFHAVQDRIVKLGQIQLTLSIMPQLLLETVFVVAALLVTVLMGYQTGVGPDTLPTLGLFGYAGFRLITMANPIVLRINEIQSGRPAVEALANDLALMERESRERPTHGAAAPAFRRELRVENVSYRYPSVKEPAVADITFALPAGASIGIVGATGAGKSTLVDLVVGLLAPTEGRIVADDAEISAAPARWRTRIGYVPQSVFLLDDSLRRNVALGIDEDDIDDEAVLRAIQMAQLDSLVSRWPDGVHTRLGERGNRLSGGERQRVGIARALYHDPDLLIFDEATSSLDNITEAEVSRAIESLRGRKSLVVIAHRLSTVRKCDRLLYLDAGRIVAQGSYDELLATDERFQRLATGAA